MATAFAAAVPEGMLPAIIEEVSANPGIVLTDRAKFNDFYARMKEETDKLDPDTSTAKGREAIRKMATRVRDTKAAIDKRRLELTKEKRDWIDGVNAAGKEIKDSLQALEDSVRFPLTEWEEAEKARVAECEAVIQRIRDAATVTIDDTFASVQQRGSSVHQTVIDPERFGTLAETALQAKKATVDILMEAMKRLKKEEADRAELERLRAEQAERERVEAEKAAAAEIERKAAEAARIEEERKAAAEQAEKDRIAAAEKAAEERARQLAARQAQEERDRIQREHEAALQAERDRAAEAERLAQAERDRIAEIERQREQREAAERADAARLAEEQRRREADQAHRTEVKSKAKAALMTCGADEETARKIVVAIMAGEIPSVSLAF